MKINKHALYGFFVGILLAASASYSANYVKAVPYNYPHNGDLRPENTALIIIDMQRDFLDKDGYAGQIGCDVPLLREIIGPVQNLLTKARQVPGLFIVHTREGHRPDLTDLPDNKRFRSRLAGGEIGSSGPLGRILVRGEAGWQIIEELTPIPGEPIIDKPGKGSFNATDLELLLRDRHIRNLIIAGVTTDVCVHTTMREANDKSYECIVLSDCTMATVRAHHESALEMVQMQHGVFGCVGKSEDIINDFFNRYIK